MQEQITENNPSRYVFRPKDNEKSDLITNEYLKKMPRDENLRYELIGGEIIVSIAPRYIHQLMVTRIVVEISKYLEKNSIGEILTTPGLILSEFDGVIPDLIYISHERRDEILDVESGKFHGSPEIIIEILTPGRANARRDLKVKRELFEIYEAQEYWVVNPFDLEIIVFRNKKGGLHEDKIYKEGDKLKSIQLPDFELDVKKLFAN